METKNTMESSTKRSTKIKKHKKIVGITLAVVLSVVFFALLLAVMTRKAREPIPTPAILPQIKPGQPSLPPKPEEKPTKPPFQPEPEKKPTRPPFQPEPEKKPTRPPFQPEPEKKPTRPPFQPEPEKKPTRPPFQPEPEKKPTRPPFQPEREEKPTKPPAKPLFPPKPKEILHPTISPNDVIVTSIPLPEPRAGKSIVAQLSAFGNMYLRFFGPPAPGTFHPLYENDHRTVTASVNAGNEGLWVGGGGINAAFKNELGNTIYETSIEAHKNAMRQPMKRIETGASTGIIASTYFGLAYQHSELPQNSGALFIDEVKFKSGSKYDQPQNKYMLYVVGPNGAHLSRGKFEDTLMKLGRHIGSSLKTFNENSSLNANGKINHIVLPLISGGIFRGPHDVSLVAYNLMKGLSSVRQPYPLLVDLPYIQDEGRSTAYIRAVQKVQSIHQLGTSSKL